MNFVYLFHNVKPLFHLGKDVHSLNTDPLNTVDHAEAMQHFLVEYLQLYSTRPHIICTIAQHQQYLLSNIHVSKKTH